MFDSVSLQNALALSGRSGPRLYGAYALAIWACGLSICLYFLAPFPMPFIGFSLHVFPAVLGAMLLLPQWRDVPWTRGYGLFLLAALLLMASSLSVPAQLLSHVEVKAWVTSVAIFVVCAACFRFIRQEMVVLVAEIILALTAAAAIAQVTIGTFSYVPGWFGFPRVTIYATGLTIYSSQASIMFLPLAMLVLWQNVNRPALYRYGIWGGACAGVYFTLSRAGWLAFVIGFFITAICSCRVVGNVRRVLVHLAIGLSACGFAWMLPTSLDCYEPKGNCSADRWAVLETVHQQVLDCHSLENCINRRWVSVSDYSAATRWATLQVALHAVRTNPLTGVGLGRFPDYFADARPKRQTEESGRAEPAIDPRARMTAHNGYAQLAAEAGLPMFFILILAIGHLLVNGLRSRNNSSIPLIASIVGMFVWLIFHDGFNSRLLWILLGCLASFIYVDKKSGSELSVPGLSLSKSG